MSQFAAAAHTAQEAAFETISGSRAAEMITTQEFYATCVTGGDLSVAANELKSYQREQVCYSYKVHSDACC